MANEDDVIYLAKLHPIIFLSPLIFFIIGLALSAYFEDFRLPALVIVVLALFWFLITWFTYHFTSLTIKKKRVILRTGFWVRYTTDIPLGKIESMDIKQSLIGSLLHFGNLLITGTGGTKYMISRLNRPLRCRRYIEQLMQEIVQ